MAKLDNKKQIVNKDKKNSKLDNEYSRKNRRIFLLILLLLFLISILGVSTYAWFSSNKHATIDSIDINVATVTGLQVSVDAINWGNEVTREMIENAYKTYPKAENQLPDTLGNMSTVGNVNGGKMDMFYGVTSQEANGRYSLVTKQEGEKQCTGDDECEGRHFIVFDIFLLVTTPANIAITTNSNVVPQENAQDKGAQNGARVGFVVEGTVNADSSLAAQSLKGGKTALIWEPNYDIHTEKGVEAARNIYGINTTKSGGARIPYKGVNRAFNNAVYLEDTDKSPYFSSVKPNVATTKNFSEDQPLLTIPSGITKLRIYMWLEGQDVDTENGAASSKITYNLELVMLN